MATRKRLPEWLRMKMPEGENYSITKNIVKKHKLHTICTSGNCPNIGECWSNKTSTFMILGNICTRNCKFCNVITGRPLPIDDDEPLRVANAIKLMGIKYCVITSVTRDDLPDYGSAHWAETIKKVKEVNEGIKIEALIPDFNGIHEYIQKVIDAGADIISHNLETVKRLTPQIRNKAKYETSLSVLKYIASQNKIAKTGIMLGLGETDEEIIETMDDALNAGCKIFTIGQYLQPSFEHMEVVEYIKPEKFDYFKQIGLKKGFLIVESAPLVRSSYNANIHLMIAK